MKKNFGFDTEFNKLRVIACSLWMGFKRGEGELEIEDQGRLQKSRFSQETVAIGQQTPRIGEDRPKLRLAPNTQVFTRVPSAGRTLNSDSTPQFFSSLVISKSLAEKNLNSKVQATQTTLHEILKAAADDENPAG